MAGAGYKLFNTGDVLTAAQVNTYLQEQAVMRFANSTARTTALSGVLAEGMMSYLDDTNSVEVYNGSAWVSVGSTGDIEGVTAGVGISGGGTSGTVTITNSMATAIDAKGDLVVGTGADTFARLAVGTNGHTLVADSSTSTGLKWAAPAGGGKVLQVVQATYSTATTSTSTTLADTGLSVSITPSANTSKVLIMLTQFMEVERQAAYCGGRLVLNRDATKIFDPSNGSVSLSLDVSGQSDMYMRSLQNMVYLDSPNTTSATTYKTQFAVQDPNTGSTTVQFGSATSSIVAIEIGA